MTLEQRESQLVKPDFVGEFNRRLQAIKPLSEEEGKHEAFDLRDIGINNVKRKGVAVLFSFDKNLAIVPDIWVEDYTSIDDDYPHSVGETRLNNYLGQNAPHLISSFVITGHGYVYQDREDKLFLEPTVEYIESEIEQYRDYGKSNIPLETWEELLKNYGVEAIIGLFSLTDQEKEKGIRSKLVLSQEIAAKIRKDFFLLSVAKKHELTNTEFLRLRALAMSADEEMFRAAESGESIVLLDKNKLARKIKEDRAGNLLLHGS
ncbi:MAG: hypothetical protein M1372_01655 [Patescibacteria group bacterium]|nr:hypothetical protein [Patescibacteria group bacterium]